MDIQDNSINDRRASKTRGNLLHSLSSSMKMVQDAWKVFSRIKVKNQTFMEELSGVLIGVNSIKELCINKGMIFLANQAGELEAALTELIDIPQVGDALLYQAIISQLNDLTANIENLLHEYENSESAEHIKEVETPIGEIPYDINGKRIFIISKEDKFIDECSFQIGHYGYTAHSFKEFDTFIAGMNEEKPVAVITDLDLFDDDSSLNLVDYQNQSAGIPMIIVSSDTSFQARLRAVQAGSIAFFTKPVNVSLLLDKLDAIINSLVLAEPPKVLVIDDSVTISEFLSRTLTRVGMVVHMETTPEAALAVIGSFNPDLILMDMYMPVCDGEDLCRIIRQYESFTSIPIVFLSSETDVKKQLNAMKIGADDFLTKEIDPQHLVTSITTRIQRHRILSSFMVRDSLTGLLNHTKSKKQLEQMIIKADKLKIPLAFAMVDIDHFKKVNDTYGHPTGDRVIKSLSRLLQKRLRRTDSIGRYGGEEFAIVLWDTNADNAKIILDQIREDFAKIEHHHEGKTFFTTFSSGVAEFPQYQDGPTISNAADRALYVAKGQGRNQVCIAPPDIEHN